MSTYFETFPYRVDIETGIIDYDTLEKNAQMYRPKVLVAGTSAYCRLIDYARMRKIADSIGAYLVVDMAHISGLIAAGVIPSPFEHADIDDNHPQIASWTPRRHDLLPQGSS